MLAGLLYLGSGVDLAPYRLLPRAPRGAGWHEVTFHGLLRLY